jgi:hypothetical protein
MAAGRDRGKHDRRQQQEVGGGATDDQNLLPVVNRAGVRIHEAASGRPARLGAIPPSRYRKAYWLRSPLECPSRGLSAGEDRRVFDNVARTVAA